LYERNRVVTTYAIFVIERVRRASSTSRTSRAQAQLSTGRKVPVLVKQLEFEALANNCSNTCEDVLKIERHAYADAAYVWIRYWWRTGDV